VFFLWQAIFKDCFLLLDSEWRDKGWFVLAGIEASSLSGPKSCHSCVRVLLEGTVPEPIFM
jgi:hypothetical protein